MDHFRRLMAGVHRLRMMVIVAGLCTTLLLTARIHLLPFSDVVAPATQTRSKIGEFELPLGTHRRLEEQSPTMQPTLACVYTGEFLEFDLSVSSSEEQEVSLIPAGSKNVFVRLQTDNDVDLRLEATATGTILLDWSSGVNWGTTDLTYNGMNFNFCTDSCSRSITIGPYYDDTTCAQ